ncbi:MAG: CHASE3 domain-containing protein, partial [Methylotenera sp.]
MKIIWKSIEFAWEQLWRWLEKIVVILGGRTIAMLTAALFITMVSVIFTDNWIVSIGKQDALITDIRTNINKLNNLKESLYRAESAQRGYLFTKREVYIEPFNQALNDARKNIQNIETLVILTSEGKDQHVKRDWIKAISTSLETKAVEMKLTINLAKIGKLQEAKQVVNLDEGVLEMERFMQYTNTLIENQINSLNTLIEKRKGTIVLARISVISGALILILLVVLVIKQLLKEIVIKGHLQQQVLKENEIYQEKLQQQTKLLRSLALDYQA